MKKLIIFMVALAISTHCTSLEPSRYDAEFAQMKHTLSEFNSVNIGEKETVCSLQNPTLVYVGATSERLIECLIESPAAKQLRITSSGGSVEIGMEAARIISARKIHLIINGSCASSCGNYLIPAAESVTILPYSDIQLHGGAHNDYSHISDMVIDAFEHINRVPSRTEIESGVNDLLGDRQTQDNFLREFNVNLGWIDLLHYRQKLKTLPEDQKAMFSASIEFMTLCMPNLNITDESWSPKSEEDFKRLKELHGTPYIRDGYNLPTPENCDGTPNPINFPSDFKFRQLTPQP